jgi:hypothetical protein
MAAEHTASRRDQENISLVRGCMHQRTPSGAGIPMIGSQIRF